MYFPKFSLWSLFLFILLILAACQTAPPPIEVPAVPKQLLQFDNAVRALAKNLLTTVLVHHTAKMADNPASPPKETAMVVFNPVVDMASGQAVKAGSDIENLFYEETHKNFKQFKIERITQDSLKVADYVVNSVINYDFSPQQPSTQHYYVASSVIDWSTKKVVAQGDVWIGDAKLDFTPEKSSEANPMYVKGLTLDTLVQIAKSPVGSSVSNNFTQFLNVRSLLVEAQTAQDDGKDEDALRLFDKVIQLPGGNIMEAYGGKYAIYFKRGNQPQAEENFYKMVQMGVEQNGVIPVKFVFVSARTDFYDNPILRSQYDIWLRQLSRYFKENTGKCVEIAGHTSKSARAGEEFNRSLSEKRAQRIQKEMSKLFTGFGQRSKTVGKGSLETIVGTEPDDEGNAIDRRVEFKVIDCLQVGG
jgi:outer membrane protein OmpA-like peptidoglycan-associated protein